MFSSYILLFSFVFTSCLLIRITAVKRCNRNNTDNNSEGGVSLISLHWVALAKLSAEHGMTHIPALLSLIAALWQRLD